MTSTDNSTEFVLNKFDPLSMPATANILILGGNSSGRTTLVRDLLRTWGKSIPLNRRILYSAVEKFVHKYRRTEDEETSIMPRNSVFANLKKDRSHLDKLVREQEARVFTANVAVPRAVAVIEDDQTFSKYNIEAPVENIIMNGRHFRTSFIRILQNPMELPPALRSNFDYIFILQGADLRHIKKAFGVDSKIVIQLIGNCKDYRCAVLIRPNASTPGPWCWYKAEAGQK